MIIPKVSLSCVPWFLFITLTFAQSDCEGDTSTYDENGLVVPFRNLCGKDIRASVDFLDGSTKERSWADCRKRCVEKEPLCFGFDFAARSNSKCYLMNATFPESAAVARDYVDGGMLMPDFVVDLSSDCRRLGLWGCFHKNGQLEAGTDSATNTTLSTASTTTSSTTAVLATNSVASATLSATSLTTLSMPPSNTVSFTASTTADTTKAASQSDSGSLSTGAKAGIGVGVGVLVLALCLVGGYFFVKRRRQRLRDVPVDHALSVKTEPAQLAGERGPYDIAELPTTSPSHAYQQ